MEKLYTFVCNCGNCRTCKRRLCFLVLFISFILVLFISHWNRLIVPHVTKITGVESTQSVTNVRHVTNVTSITCKKCFSASFDFSVDIPNLCHDNVLVVIAIEVSPDRLVTRDVIRNTWLSKVRNTSNYRHVRYFFLAGQPGDEKTRRAILNESRVHQDIVVAAFQDTYRNLTLKTVVCMKWLASRCPHAGFFLKTDDDVWVDVDNLLGTLKKYKDQLHTSLGGLCRSGPVSRDKRSKWFVFFSEFPGKKFHPYCAGSGYVGSLHLAARVADIYVNVPYFRLEDVYMGMCLKALGYGTVSLPRFHNMAGSHTSDCSIKQGNFVAIHKIPTERMERIHRSTCNKTKTV